ncbi:DNA-binding FadR family transcriptional regulator [Bacillus mesophilus]|uniref:FadR family transcriptional regulator n=1 Tax=Bacillus mesophilus TaxID=1808955 RepID=A0A6M0Q696_9BACI|nr:DNA-binding FadR family transcriptional regulator [Bacillus mesophilus]NEY71891.1 FadR family transcriptional regulator [Bacillus mesophilus]
MSIPQSKVYIETIKQIHTIIQADSLQPGDRLPSERELTDRLGVGRSSVREALRALELLGLIETRRGEGTFVKDFGGHHLVELIGSFILQNETAKKDLLNTKRILEEQSIRIICEEPYVEKIQYLRELLSEDSAVFKEEFTKLLLRITDNRLLLKIWLLLSEYASVSSANEGNPEQEKYENLIISLEQGDVERALQEYRVLYNY